MEIETDLVIFGDCFEVFSQLPDWSVDFVFTSPPYNRERQDVYEHYQDNIEDYFDFLVNVADECMRVSKGYVFLNIQKTYYNMQDVFKLIGVYFDKIVEIIVWGKINPRPNSGNRITNAYEFFIVFGNKPLEATTTYTKNFFLSPVNTNMPPHHKAVMKQEVSDYMIETFTKPEDIVLDPFAGMGTTLLSCKRLGRKFIGIEIIHEYYLEILERLEHQTLLTEFAEFNWTDTSGDSSLSRQS